MTHALRDWQYFTAMGSQPLDDYGRGRIRAAMQERCAGVQHFWRWAHAFDARSFRARNYFDMRERNSLLGEAVGYFVREQRQEGLEFVRTNAVPVGLLNGVLRCLGTDYLLRMCDNCGETHAQEDMTVAQGGSYVCSDCIENFYVYSSWMETWLHTEDAVDMHTYGGGTEVVSYGYAENNCHYMDGEWYTHEAYEDIYGSAEDEDEDEDEDKGPIYPYHHHKDRELLCALPSQWYNANPKMLRAGVELEVEQYSGSKYRAASEVLAALNDAAQTYVRRFVGGSLNRNFVVAEEDGSLDEGFELISGWTTLDAHRFVWTRLNSIGAVADLRSHNTTTCGLHVHVDNTLSPFQKGKLIAFVNDPRNKGLIKLFARRYKTWDPENGGRSYARIKPEKLINLGECAKGVNADRYEALNFRNGRTVEWRIFRGTLNYKTLLACIEFALISHKFVIDTGLQDLNEEQFIKYVLAPENVDETVFMRAHMADKFYGPYLQIRKHRKIQPERDDPSEI